MADDDDMGVQAAFNAAIAAHIADPTSPEKKEAAIQAGYKVYPGDITKVMNAIDAAKKASGIMMGGYRRRRKSRGRKSRKSRKNRKSRRNRN